MQGLTCPTEDRHHNRLPVETEEQIEAFLGQTGFHRSDKSRKNPKEENRA